MKRFFTVIILALITISVIGCGGKPATTEIEKVEESVDLNGYVFNFGVTSHVGNMPEILPDEAFSFRGDKVLQRYKDTAVFFNCEVNVYDMGLSYMDMSSTLMASITAGEKYADLIETYPSNISGALELLQPFNGIEGLELYSGKWGSDNLIDGMSANGNSYGVYPSNWGLPYPWYDGCMFFVPEHIQAAGLSNPHEYWEKGQWTWDTFAEMCRAYTRTENEKNMYGFVVTPQLQFVKACILSNGARPISKDETGNFVFGLDDPKAITALEYFRDLIKIEKIGTYITDSWQKANRGIMSGEYAFHCDASILGFFEGDAHYATELEIPWATISFPTGPDGNKDDATVYYSGKYLVMPLLPDYSDMENNVLIMNHIFEPLDGEDANSWKSYIRENFFFEDDSFNHFIKNYEKAYPSYSIYLTTSNAKIVSVMDSVFNGKKAASEIVASVMTAVQTELDEINSK